MRIREKGEWRRDGRRQRAVTATQKRAFYTKSTPAEQGIVPRRRGCARCQLQMSTSALAGEGLCGDKRSLEESLRAGL